jgi:hypothetical protein
MKAKLGGAIVPATDRELAVARMQSAPRAAHEVFLGNAVAAADPLLDRLISVKTADLIAKPTKPIFHDVTTASLGLLTNVRGGGFRKDLNFLLETPIPAVNSAAVAPLYTAGSTAGINFGELWADHAAGELEADQACAGEFYICHMVTGEFIVCQTPIGHCTARACVLTWA